MYFSQFGWPRSWFLIFSFPFFSTKRVPSWTDRVLYATHSDSPDTPDESNITNLLYTSIPSYTTSDHVCYEGQIYFYFVMIDIFSSETYCLFITPTSYSTTTGCCCSNVTHDSTSEHLQTTTRPIRLFETLYGKNTWSCDWRFMVFVHSGGCWLKHNWLVQFFPGIGSLGMVEEWPFERGRSSLKVAIQWNDILYCTK